MDGINPLYAPELLIMIAEYLKKRHIIKCLQVCKHWYHILVPLIWRSVDILKNPKDPGTTGSALTKECFLKYSDFIFDLSTRYIHPDHCTMTFPNIHTMCLSGPFFDTPNNRGDSYAVDLVSLNPSLVYINVFLPNSTPDVQFWEAVSKLQYLKSMRTFYVALHEDDMETFWKVLSKLEDVDLEILKFPTVCHQPSFTFYRLRKIKLNTKKSDYGVQLQFIQSCPNLEDLHWRVWRETEVPDKFRSDVEHGLWPKLEAIYLDIDKDEEYFSHILNSMQRVTRITMKSKHFGPLSFQSLQHHFGTLSRVNLMYCPAATSPFILEIFCSCPFLEDFSADVLYAKYIENCRPWVCLSMKKLCLCLYFAEPERNLHPVVFKRLSTLTHLAAIDIGGLGYYHTLPPNGTHLDMRLKSGLGLLSTWRNIRTLYLRYTIQAMDETDIQWIISNWGRIETIYGKLNQDSQVNTHLRAMLQARDIEGS